MYLIGASERMPACVVLPTLLGSMVDHYARQRHELISQRAYEFFEQRGCQCGRDLDDWLRAEREEAPVEIADTRTELIVSVQVQGVERRQLEVLVGASEIVITRKQWPDHDEDMANRILGENSAERSAQLVRAIPLPCSIIPERAAVRLHDDGLMDLTLPKTTEWYLISNLGGTRWQRPSAATG
jgi:HSP20 family molecular chaperone IbpA